MLSPLCFQECGDSDCFVRDFVGLIFFATGSTSVQKNQTTCQEAQDFAQTTPVLRTVKTLFQHTPYSLGKKQTSYPALVLCTRSGNVSHFGSMSSLSLAGNTLMFSSEINGG